MASDRPHAVRLPQELVEWAKEHAGYMAAVLGSRVTFSDVIRLALEDYRRRNP